MPTFKSVKNIPVTMNFDHTRPPIGVADIDEDGTITITVKEKHMTADLKEIFGRNVVREFSLGFSYYAPEKNNRDGEK